MKLESLFYIAWVCFFSFSVETFAGSATDIIWRESDVPNYKNEVSQYDFSGEKLKIQWDALHAEDLYPYPTEENFELRVSKNKKLRQIVEKEIEYFSHKMKGHSFTDEELKQLYLSDITNKLLNGFRLLHSGQLEAAYNVGQNVGYFGRYLSGHALYANAYYLAQDWPEKEEMLKAVVSDMKKAERIEPHNDSFKFLHLYALGRILERLDFSLSLMPDYQYMNKWSKRLVKKNEHHLGARLIYAAFLAQGSIKSPFLAKMRFGASLDKSVRYFEETLETNVNTIAAYYTYMENLKKMNIQADTQVVLLEKIAAMQPLDANGAVIQHLAKSQLDANL